MLQEHFQLIYQTLLTISTHSATFSDEQKLVKCAQKALATADVKQMWQALLDTALCQGFHQDEKRIINTAQLAVKQLLPQIKMIDVPAADKDLEFLVELRGRLEKAFDNQDTVQREYAFQMIDDWIDELREAQQ
jgi:hypothetical protein